MTVKTLIVGTAIAVLSANVAPAQDVNPLSPGAEAAEQAMAQLKAQMPPSDTLSQDLRDRLSTEFAKEIVLCTQDHNTLQQSGSGRAQDRAAKVADLCLARPKMSQILQSFGVGTAPEPIRKTIITMAYQGLGCRYDDWRYDLPDEERAISCSMPSVAATSIPTPSATPSRILLPPPIETKSVPLEPTLATPGAQPNAVMPCGGNSNEQVTQPVLNLYDAIRHRDIDRYADQWSEGGVYVRADTGNVKSLEEKLAERRAAFKRWKNVYINANDISISSRDILSATVKVRYSMATQSYNSTNSGIPEEALESYDVKCVPPTENGKWLIVKNTDFLNRVGNIGR
jgi:hypothetical protein